MILIGHAGHEEVVGTMGEIPDSIVARRVARRRSTALEFPEGTKLAYVTQTTLSVDETGEMIAALRERFPAIRAPQREDICYATSNRQWAVKELLDEVDLLLVIGSRNSSNSNRLVETARAGGVPSYLIDDETEIDEAWLDGVAIVGITSGASAPEKLVAARLRLVPRARRRPTSRRTASSRRTSSSACRSSCGASSRWPTRRTERSKRRSSLQDARREDRTSVGTGGRERYQTVRSQRTQP